MTAVTSRFLRSAAPPFAENVEASAAPVDLPAGATDVSYAKGFRGTVAYEFTIDEEGFREWVAAGIGSFESRSAQVPLREIVFPARIIRYYFYADLPGPDTATIEHGLDYSWSKEDRSVRAVYDRATGRAYYHAVYH
jgi:hypothetical protein